MHILRSSREIAQLRKAGLLVWQAHQLAGALVKPGVTTGEIDAAIEKFFLEQRRHPAVQGRARQGPLPRRGLHFGQRRSGARHSRPPGLERRGRRQHRHRLQTGRLVRRLGRHAGGRKNRPRGPAPARRHQRRAGAGDRADRAQATLERSGRRNGLLRPRSWA